MVPFGTFILDLVSYIDADMTSAELKNSTEAINPELSVETIQEWPNLPDKGTEGLPLTTDQLSLVTESVWQWIGHWLDAKCTWDSNECDYTLDELTELQGKFTDLSDKYRASETKILSLRREWDALWGELDSLRPLPDGALSNWAQTNSNVVLGPQAMPVLLNNTSKQSMPCMSVYTVHGLDNGWRAVVGGIMVQCMTCLNRPVLNLKT